MPLIAMLDAAPAPVADWLGDIAVTDIGAASLLSFVVLALIKGWLVPRRTLVDRLADKDAELARQVEEKKMWREAAQTALETNTELTGQLSEALEGARITAAVVGAMDKARTNDG